ncbi:hypothetical protein PMAYCL1PPCAC_06960, partial [Pristionchus mayeri]
RELQWRYPSSSEEWAESPLSDAPSTMARFHSFTIMRVVAYLILLFLSLHLLLSYVVNRDGNAMEESSLDESLLSPLASELCQYLELKDAGVEGEIDGEEYKLKGVTVLFRHGERSPIVKDHLSNHKDCEPSRDSDRRHFKEFEAILDSKEFRKFIKVDKKFKDVPFYPPRSECSPGNMTAEGSLQLSRLGNHLRRVYESTNLFKNPLDVKVTVSPFRRTFQSAVAFLSSFVFPLKELVDEVFIRYSNETFHCTDSFCVCPAAFKWRSVYEKEHYEYFLGDSTGFREKTQRLFGGIEATKESKDPFQMMDVILGRYLCRRHPPSLLQRGRMRLIRSTEGDDGVHFETRTRDVQCRQSIHFRSLHTSEAQAILGYVAMMGEELMMSPHIHRVKVFSGHDTTVGPVLRTLRLPFVDFPRYASHVVFEIYHDGEGTDFLRLIYNGVDRTADCHSVEERICVRCPSYTRFSRSGIFAALGFLNVTQLCDPSLTPQPHNAYV